MNTQKQIFLIVVLFFAMTGGCAAYAAIELPHRQPLQEEYQYEGRVERGALLFANNCRTCHGNAGEGGVGLPLNTDEFKDQSPLVLAANQQLLRHTLQCGRAGTLMPAWLKENGGALSRIQIEHLVEFITQPATEVDEEGNPTSQGWLHALEFAHNLNHEASAVVGGDTLSGIAKSHNIGPEELYKLNEEQNRLEFQDGEEPGINGLLKRGSKVRLLPNASDKDGYIYQIRQDNETIQKISDSQSIGPIILADLNAIPYTMNYKSAILQLHDVQAPTQDRPGLLPGTTLKLPDNTTYTLTAGDTIADIAAKHGKTASEIVSLNRTILGSYANDAELDVAPKITLPNGTPVVVGEGDTLATLATTHGLELLAFATLNDRAVEDVVNPGETLKLPNGTKYTIQAGDTVGDVAKDHNLNANAVAAAANLTGATETTKLATHIEIALPKIDAFKVEGQDLEELAGTFSGTATADDWGEVNGVPANAILYIGQTLKLPDDVWGSAPPDAVNLGTACVQYAVPNSVYQENVLGISSTPDKPTTQVKDVTINANASDWTIVSDGATQTPNKGAVLIAVGTVVKFAGVTGIHNIFIDDKEVDPDFRAGENTTFTFSTAGDFLIECRIHPGMNAYVWVE